MTIKPELNFSVPTLESLIKQAMKSNRTLEAEIEQIIKTWMWHEKKGDKNENL